MLWDTNRIHWPAPPFGSLPCVTFQSSHLNCSKYLCFQIINLFLNKLEKSQDFHKKVTLHCTSAFFYGQKRKIQISSQLDQAPHQKFSHKSTTLCGVINDSGNCSFLLNLIHLLPGLDKFSMLFDLPSCLSSPTICHLLWPFLPTFSLKTLSQDFKQDFLMVLFAGFSLFYLLNQT